MLNDLLARLKPEHLQELLDATKRTSSTEIEKLAGVLCVLMRYAVQDEMARHRQRPPAVPTGGTPDKT